MFCTQCGTSLPENSAFCPQCGVKISPALSQAPAAPNPVPPPPQPVPSAPRPVAPTPQPVAPRPAAPVPRPVAVPSPADKTPHKPAWMAILGFIFSFICWTPYTAIFLIPGVIFSFMGLKSRRKGLSVAAIIIYGIFFVLISISVIILIVSALFQKTGVA